MGPETALAIIVALLWGPTALWVIIRLARASEARRFESDSGGPVLLVDQNVLEDELGPEADKAQWICASCRSVNRPGAKRCYSCRAKRDGGDQASRTADRDRMMAHEVDRADTASVDGGPEAAVPPIALPAAATGSASRSPQPGAEAPRIPQLRTGLVCPFLGLETDRTTWFDFPAHGNLCYAGVAPPPKGRRLVDRLVGRVPRGQPIDAAHQQDLCLTRLHARCARFTAVAGFSGIPPGNRATTPASSAAPASSSSLPPMYSGDAENAPERAEDDHPTTENAQGR